MDTGPVPERGGKIEGAPGRVRIRMIKRRTDDPYFFGYRHRRDHSAHG
jgi:hypothetical protein